jgi:hypothetical protein
MDPADKTPAAPPQDPEEVVPVETTEENPPVPETPPVPAPGEETPPVPAQDDSLLDEAEKEIKAEEAKLLEAKDEDLSPEDLAKKQELVKGKEEEVENKRLLETKDEDLTPEELERKQALVKAKEKKDESENKAVEAPEKYEFKAPEGIPLDEALAEKVTPIFKELDLSQEKAQKLVDLYTKIRMDETTQQQADFKQFEEDSKAATKEALGANWKQEMAFAAKVKQRFFSETTMQKLRDSGLANNKDLIQDLIKVGRMISEDKIPGGGPAGGPTSPADLIYGKNK